MQERKIVAVIAIARTLSRLSTHTAPPTSVLQVVPMKNATNHSLEILRNARFPIPNELRVPMAIEAACMPTLSLMINKMGINAKNSTARGIR
jgi:hypothetical protein